ncbi:sugar ABC transporter substrate-binding protein [Streptomyces sp. TRM66268-LWL]|uniref:Sugar ABC transporter substrate-binding protein n=1 Tax=Streptomyces polyasparticus TaxID=2767826 RepID=A0ABR7SDX4_9ACTN|nr:sugar ABC transporter substrate-binding protein [Streptomyces polyasparticus]MBC9712676.1 sugar ABC transporter substrate-binding protein [Streptomyces polyasparticus]
MRSTHRRAGAALLCLAATAGLVSCGGSDSASGKTTLDYWLWDDKQLPAYKECADAFEKANPDIAVKITQTAWNQYWQNLTTQLTSGDAPDVWTDQASYYPQFATNGQLLDLQPLIDRDKVDLSGYQEGLADVWVKDGKRYGLPKDWDSMALVYNTAQFEKQGVSTEQLADLKWNPDDGGTLEQAIAKATVDAEGRNGLDPAFDKKNVKTYGFLPEWADGATGQNGWGPLAASNGFTYLDKNPWGTEYKYDDPKLAETIAWFKRLIDKGYAPRFDKQSSVGNTELLSAGKGAMMIAGSWTISTFTDPKARQKFAFAPLPAGPEGRKSSLNGLSDAIWAGTEHKEEAWKWVKYLGSAECQDKVGKRGVVLPAQKSGTEAALAAHTAAGRDISAFTDIAADKNSTFMLPVTEHGTEINPLVQDAVQSVILGQAEPGPALKSVNEKVNGLFK